MKTGGELAFLPERTCGICYQDQNPTSTSESEVLAISGASGGVVGSAQTDITNPYEAIPCGCIYCFVCLAQRLEAEEGEGWVCLRCGEIVKECKAWNGDVLEEVTRPGSGKTVGFSEEEHGECEMKEVEPKPETDEKEAEVEQELNEVAQSPEARELDESGEWAQMAAEATPDEDEDSEESAPSRNEEDYHGTVTD